MEVEALLSGLNTEQHRAVAASMNHTLVLAGAGSGKTRALVYRIAYLVRHYGLAPYSIMAVTFTNKAAKEMRHRLEEILPMSLRDMWVGTFHGLCHQLLRRHYEKAGLSSFFAILDSDDQARLIKRVLVSMNLSDELYPVKKVQSFINEQKDSGLRPHEVQIMPYGPQKEYVSIYKAYEDACRQADSIDFAELMLRTLELFRNHPDILNHYQTRFQAILVDEFQDTNTVQYAWIRLLSGAGAVVMAVGDDDQSIYSWRGAKVENMKKFVDDFPSVDVIRLEQNYRSTGTILEASNHLITHNQARMGKALWTSGVEGEKIVVYRALNEDDEAKFIVKRILHLLDDGVSLDEIALLYRANALSRVLEEKLIQAGISYKIYGGVRFFERSEIKDMLAYLRLIVHPEDNLAFERVVNFPTRGIGEKTLEEIRAYAKETGLSFWESAQILTNQSGMSERALRALSGFLLLIVELQEGIAAKPLDQQVNHVLQHSGLLAHFGKIKGEQSFSRIQNLEELVNAASEFSVAFADEEAADLSAFLAYATLEGGERTSDDSPSSVQLMTLHAAKGLEFPYVFMTGLEEGMFPSHMSISNPMNLEEERRLCYVGMTRAMKRLFMTHAEVRRVHGRTERRMASRFVKELPKHLLEEMGVNLSEFRKTSAMNTTAASYSKVVYEETGFSLGQPVAHKTFGQGTIIAFEGQGANARVHVKFSDGSTKWLSLAYANLTA